MCAEIRKYIVYICASRIGTLCRNSQMYRLYMRFAHRNLVQKFANISFIYALRASEPRAEIRKYIVYICASRIGTLCRNSQIYRLYMRFALRNLVQKFANVSFIYALRA